MDSSKQQLLRDLAQSKRFRAEFVKSHVKRLLPIQIRDLMEQRGYNQSKLAELSGVSQGTISRAIDPEYGNLNVGTCVSIADGFDVAFVGHFVPFSELMDWVDKHGSGEHIPSFDEEYDEQGTPKQHPIESVPVGTVPDDVTLDADDTAKDFDKRRRLEAVKTIPILKKMELRNRDDSTGASEQYA